jgi:hypothetical protein
MFHLVCGSVGFLHTTCSAESASMRHKHTGIFRGNLVQAKWDWWSKKVVEDGVSMVEDGVSKTACRRRRVEDGVLPDEDGVSPVKDGVSPDEDCVSKTACRRGCFKDGVSKQGVSKTACRLSKTACRLTKTACQRRRVA